MLDVGGKVHHWLLVVLWRRCGQLRLTPFLFSCKFVEPIHKGVRKDPRDSPAAHCPINVASALKEAVEEAIRLSYEASYRPVSAQHGCRKRVSQINAVLRVLSASRLSDGPVALLDIRGAYSGVDRAILIFQVREKIGSNNVAMQSVLLQSTAFRVIGDPEKK